MTGLAVVPGSFDPITLGHRDVIQRAAQLFGRVVVGVATNPNKQPLFSLEERMKLIQDDVDGIGVVEVAAVPGLLVDFCRQMGATAIVKGLRGGPDWSHEVPMAQINRELTQIETVFLAAAPNWGHVSSTLVKDLARHGGDLSRYVSPGVAAALKQRFGPSGTVR
ncbi:MAG: pantetheine-phosphate adenylyltransferase [Bifidobacteriaceae bacterium]|jgi:pantetheine-phosphate adenylyltransferase|nr:pantetheine-phosphate adenylyltransferase [Bifidobacteriaceae bacterium]